MSHVPHPPQSPASSSEGDYEEDAPTDDVQWTIQTGGKPVQPAATDHFASTPPRIPAVPMQKRRRVTRACDECRRKKIKCDGKQPCTHCTVYSYDCTYDQPSNRRRNPAPQYIEALELKLQRAETIIRTAMPDVNLDDPSLDTAVPPHVTTYPKHGDASTASPGRPTQWLQSHRLPSASEVEKDSMLESMVENTGTLDIDDDGHWDFHGHSSGRAFLGRMREQFGTLMGKPNEYPMPSAKAPSDSPSVHSQSPAFSVQSPTGFKSPNTSDLPPKDVARCLCENALDDACAILRFIHQPTFYAIFDRIYETPSDHLSSEELRFLPLLYSALALGTLFSTAEQSPLMTNGFQNAIQQGSHYYKTSRSMMEVTDCRDLTSLQTVLFMTMFLQCTSKLSTCYSHVGICLRSAIRMGLHRAVRSSFNPIEEETRKRVFWCVRKLDTYVGALLGLPQMLSDDDIDQEQPIEVDDECITEDQVLPMPVGRVSLMAGFNAHTRIVAILSKTVKYIYPIKGKKAGKSDAYIVSHAKIREIERDLQAWMENLPECFRPGGEVPHEFVRIQHLLRMAYAHIEMFLYRPFLHYVSKDFQAKSFDQRSYACAAACVSVSRNIIHLTGQMKRRALLNGSYWFYMYSTFFAIISLVFYVLENPNSSTSAEVLKDAHEGKDTLAELASKSLAADRCSRHLADLFEQLPERLKGAQMKATSTKKRSKEQQQSLGMKSAPDLNQSNQSANALGNPTRRPNTSPLRRTNWQQPPMSFNAVNSTMDPAYSHVSRDPFTPTAAGSIHSPQNPLFLHTPIHDLSSVMFPSGDPFVYPNQPMTALEDRQHIKQEQPVQQDVFGPGASNGYDHVSAPAYAGGPSYNILPSSQPGGFVPQQGLSMNTDGQANSNVPPSRLPPGWVPQQQQIGRGSQQLDLDQLFGEDWGGWMNQGYR